MRQLVKLTIIGAAVGALGVPACGASSGGTSPTGLGQGGNSGSGTGGIISVGGSGNSTGGIIGIDTGNSGGNAGTSSTDGCYGVTSGVEQVVTYSPIALLIMQDRSYSMASGFPSGSAQSWPNSITALTQFVNDPKSQGLDVGLGFFPLPGGTAANCLGCDQLPVPIGPIAQTGPQIISVMNAGSSTPVLLDFTPLQCGLQGMIDGCHAYMQQHGEQCVAVFVTDGNTSDPTPLGATCDTNTTNLLAIVSNGLTQNVKTFALGLVSGAMSFVNQVAQAGGTNTGFDITQGGAQAFVDALNSIRSTITVQTTLPCQWYIPPTTPDGASVNPTQVNLNYSATTGGTATTIGHVGSEADCATYGGGWYYDNNANPTQVLACPDTCTTLTNATQGSVTLVFGCATIPAVPR